MNIIFLSPHFPKNYYLYCKRLKELGVNVLGIGEQEYHLLNKELIYSLTEYYKVKSMENYDEVLRAVGFFTHKYGKIDIFESLNEHWLETEAKIRTDFNINGFKLDKLEYIKRKSKMKKIFKNANAKIIDYIITNSLEELLNFSKKYSYLIIAKPDIGVGASNTYKLTSKQEIIDFFQKKDENIDYIYEQFINGRIFSFDALTDNNGKIIFSGALEYDCSVAEVVNNDLDVFYHTLREIPNELRKIGENIIKLYGFKKRFFHIEFFKLDDGSFIALEANIRPPGGFSIDMYNYSNDFDLYKIWAEIITEKSVQKNSENLKYYCGYIGIKNRFNYKNSYNKIKKLFYNNILHYQEMPELFKRAMGDFGYLIRETERKKLYAIKNFILDKT